MHRDEKRQVRTKRQGLNSHMVFLAPNPSSGVKRSDSACRFRMRHLAQPYNIQDELLDDLVTTGRDKHLGIAHISCTEEQMAVIKR